MKEIQLTKGYVALVDAEDFEWLSQFTWRVIKPGGYIYATSRINGRFVYLHRLVMSVTDKNIYVDHIDQNTLNNIKSNLRTCTKAENHRNGRMRPNNKSGYRGVHWVGPCKRWHVQIKQDGKTKYLGRFTDLIIAAKAYNKAAKEIHGDFATLNIV